MIGGDIGGDRVCYLCITRLRIRKMESYSNINEVLVFYSNWKDASGDKGGFASRECSSVHKRAVDVVKPFLKQPLILTNIIAM